MEQLDQAVAATETQGFPRYTARIAETTTTHYQPQLLEGVVVLENGAWLPAEPANLYQADLPHAEAPRPTTLRLIPYYAWSNRRALCHAGLDSLPRGVTAAGC